MKTVCLPNSEIKVSVLALGCWGLTSDFHWGPRDEQESTATIHAALDAGVCFFDTAEAYGDGKSEVLLGQVLRGRRDQAVIATKVHPNSMEPAKILQACQQSLERLQTDYIDLYQTHWVDPQTPFDECWEAMLRLKQQGKVRAVGVCNLGVGHLGEIHRLERPVTNQLPYNLLWRCIEQEILPHCRQHEIGVLAYSPLMHGLLAGKYASAADVPDGRARSRHFSGERSLARHGESGCEEQTFEAIHQIGVLCQSLGRDMADVALAWLVGQPGVTSVIAGARSPEQLQRNLQSIGEPLPEEIIQRLDQATRPLSHVLGPNPDMWQGTQDSRYR